MQKCCSKLRSLAAAAAAAFPKPQFKTQPPPATIPHRGLHSFSNLYHTPLSASLIPSKINSTLNGPSLSPLSPYSPLFNPSSFVQVRYITAKQRKKKLKSRRPATPIVSKVKKIKMKGYSSYKGRFRVMKNGQIRRWKEGKQHNAHLKSKKAKRRLRQPGTVPVAYAKVMKKLGFCS